MAVINAAPFIKKKGNQVHDRRSDIVAILLAGDNDISGKVEIFSPDQLGDPRVPERKLGRAVNVAR